MVIVVFLCSPEGFSIFSVVDCVIFNIRRRFWSTPSSSDTLFFLAWLNHFPLTICNLTYGEVEGKRGQFPERSVDPDC